MYLNHGVSVIIVLSLGATIAGVRQLFFFFFGFDCLLDEFQNFWQV